MTYNTWPATIDYVLTECADIHKWYSIDQNWLYLTDKNGDRHRITVKMNREEVTRIILSVKQINAGVRKPQRYHSSTY